MVLKIFFQMVLHSTNVDSLNIKLEEVLIKSSYFKTESFKGLLV